MCAADDERGWDCPIVLVVEDDPVIREYCCADDAAVCANNNTTGGERQWLTRAWRLICSPNNRQTEATFCQMLIL